MSLKNAITSFAPFENKLVHLTIGPNEYNLRLATEEDYMEYMSRMSDHTKLRKAPVLCVYRGELPLIELTELMTKLPKRSKKIAENVGNFFGGGALFIRRPNNADICDSVGAKAFNLASLMTWKLEPVNTLINDLSFVIPFCYFQNYVDLVAKDEIINLNKSNGDGYEELLSAIRKKIRHGKIPSDWNLKELILKKFENWRDTILMNDRKGSMHKEEGLFADGYIFRSSTNCEDLDGI